MKTILGLLVMCVLLFSCNTPKEVQAQNYTVHTQTIKEIVKDTVYIVKADTSKFEAALRVDESGTISIQNIQESKAGKYVRVPKVKIKDNILEVDCYAEAQKLHKQWIERHRKDSEVRYITKTEFKKAPLPWYQTLQIWLGRIALIFVLIGVLGYYVKPFKLRNRG